MGIFNKLLNIMPYNCTYCIQGFKGMVHVSDEAETQGLDLIESQAEDAVKEPVWNTLEASDPIFVNGFGHGDIGIFTGDTEQAIFTTAECDILAGRVVYLLSCKTAVQLGPAVISAGGITYIGFNIDWTWIANDLTADPYDDWYAEGFYRANNEFPIALIQRDMVSVAKDRSIAKYNEWIVIWETERSGDPKSADVIGWLIYDRDGLTVLGDQSATIVSIELPTVTTNLATGQFAIIMNGILDNNGGEPCNCGFEWGETEAYGNTTPTQSRNSGEPFSQDLDGLLPGITYHFRSFATNSIGTSYGADSSFIIEGCIIGEDDKAYRVQSLILGTAELSGSEIMVIMETKVDGVLNRVYEREFNRSPGHDPSGLWIVNGTVGIHEALLVKLKSNNPGDDGKVIKYDYILEPA